MPLYDYRCHKCGQTFEVRQKFADALLTAHDGCGGDLERLISAPALQFKGTGWYVTDYGKNGKLPAANGKSESKGESNSDSNKSDSKNKSDSQKSDSKPESKSESKSQSKSESKSDSKSESKPSPSTSSSDK